MIESRDYSTISPSAKMLLLVKAQTDLPFARQAAEMLWGAESVETARRSTEATAGAVRRRAHFELRARSIDEALRDLNPRCVLELASGLSFRGLALAACSDTYYLDTDLPAIASIKADLVARLHPAPLQGTLLVRPLDALDASAFRASVAEMPRGPLAIVHEGLLMYLDEAEKARLAASVRESLVERGGAWITADIYRRSDAPVVRDERTKKFLEEHRVEENKFADFAAAESFFTRNGFTIARKLSPTNDPWPVRETWVLSPHL